MALYIVQHGKSLTKEQDPQKGLSPEGIEEVKRIAGVAQQYGVKVRQIQHSGKLRAQQTADILADYLKPDNGVKTVSGIKPLDDVEPFASQLDVSADTMVVGHLPFLERLTSLLIIGHQSPTLFKLQNGGILCMDRLEGSDPPVIKWALMPHVE